MIGFADMADPLQDELAGAALLFLLPRFVLIIL